MFKLFKKYKILNKVENFELNISDLKSTKKEKEKKQLRRIVFSNQLIMSGTWSNKFLFIYLFLFLFFLKINYFMRHEKKYKLIYVVKKVDKIY